MNPNSIMNGLFYHVLEQQFGNNRREMAVQLRVSERTLRNAMENEQAAEMALVFEQILRYSLEHGICMDGILAQYKKAHS